MRTIEKEFLEFHNRSESKCSVGIAECGMQQVISQTYSYRISRIVMLVNLLGLLLFPFVIHAQTPYFYYYKGEKQYFELDTKHIFVSFADTTHVFVLDSVKHGTLEFNASKKTQSESINNRVWTILEVEDNLSETTYWTKLSEIKNGSITFPMGKISKSSLAQRK